MICHISKLEAGLLKLDYSEVAVPALIEDCLHQVAALTLEKEMVITHSVPSRLPPLRADESKYKACARQSAWKRHQIHAHGWQY